MKEGKNGWNKGEKEKEEVFYSEADSKKNGHLSSKTPYFLNPTHQGK